MIFMKSIAFLCFMTLLTVISCRMEPQRISLSLKNNSNNKLRIYFNDNENHKSVYPDTLITDFENRIFNEEILPNNTLFTIGSSNWESLFNVSTIQDTLSLFIFHSDTLSVHSWEEVRQGYKVLARYDLSLEDLERLDFELSYPPDARMVGIKKYPR